MGKRKSKRSLKRLTLKELREQLARREKKINDEIVKLKRQKDAHFSQARKIEGKIRRLEEELRPKALKKKTATKDMKDSFHYRERMIKHQKEIIKEALEETGGNNSKAAALLDLPRSTFHLLKAKLGI